MSPTHDAAGPLYRVWQRCTAAIVLIAFGMLTLAPTAAVAREHGAELMGLSLSTAGQPDEARFAAALQRLTARIERLAERIEAGLPHTAEVGQISALDQELQRLDGILSDTLARIERRLQDQGAPADIQARHAEMQAFYRDRFTTLSTHLRALIDARDSAALRHAVTALRAFLTSFQQHRSPAPFDHDHLPFSPQQPLPDNRPRDSMEAFEQSGLRDSPPLQYAALDNYRFDALPGATDPALLGETPEIRIGPAIQAQAAELGHDPVRIYHFVRNTIEWLPSWGAVQDAELTLSARRGNSLDIASLLIALLRASGIPARYAHGTVDIPEDRFRNWAGGFASAQAAADYASSGGIPAMTIVSGGQVVRVRIEHVWVEAAIDYVPSRGAVMRSADTWTALDASFKQYDYLPGLDVAAIANLDGEALAAAFIGSGTVNEQQGWIQGLDPTLLTNAQEQARAALEAHIQQMTDPTVGDVVGGRRTIVQDAPVLPSGLPYHRVVTGARYTALPAALRPTITFGFGRDVLGDPVRQQTWPWARLNNRKVTLSFRPATAADETALLGLLPSGQITDISQLPSSIPAYLIRVVPELKVEGETVLTGDPMRLGEELAFSYTVRDPVQGPRRSQNWVVAGSYLAVGVVGGSVAPVSLTDAQQRLETTKAALESADEALLAGLGREDLLGDLFHAGLLGYFAQLQALGQLAAQAQGNHFQLAPSAGTYGYVPEVTYFFGLPRSIVPGGAEMDLDHLSIVTSTDGQGHEAWKNFNFQLGALSSALEHAVPEQMFITEDAPGEAVSAVKALQKASSQGQRIYHITQTNQAAALPNIRHNALVMNEIRAALAVGRDVIVHTDPISVPGWTGAGYVIYDPGTGAGAWKIGGGANGGKMNGGLMSEDQAIALGFFGFSIGLAGAGLSVPLLVAISAIIALTLAVHIYIEYSEIMHDCLGLGYLVGLAIATYLVGVLTGGIGAIVVMYIGLIAGGAALVAANSRICQRP